MMKKVNLLFGLLQVSLESRFFLLKEFRFVSCALFFLKLRGKSRFLSAGFFLQIGNFLVKRRVWRSAVLHLKNKLIPDKDIHENNLPRIGLRFPKGSHDYGGFDSFIRYLISCGRQLKHSTGAAL